MALPTTMRFDWGSGQGTWYELVGPRPAGAGDEVWPAGAEREGHLVAGRRWWWMLHGGSVERRLLYDATARCWRREERHSAAEAWSEDIHELHSEACDGAAPPKDGTWVNKYGEIFMLRWDDRLVPEATVMKPTFASSNFKGIYEKTAAPRKQYDLFSSLDKFLHLACDKASIPKRETDDFYERLEREAIEATLKNGSLSEVQAIATRLWSSAEDVAGRELCSFLNHAIRTDDMELLPTAAVIIRGVNELCVHRRKDPVRWPDDHVTFRGGGLPDEHRLFFDTTKKYRVPMFLATSFQQKVAKMRFARTAQMNGIPPVLFIVRLDQEHGCLHVNYLGDTSVVNDEDEFLFTPYSAFEVVAVRWKPAPTWMDPHEVEIRACVDNLLEPEDLPLAPWH